MGLQIERKQHEPQLEHGNLCLIDYQHLCVRERLCVCVSHTNIHSSYSHSRYSPTNHSTPLMHINSCAYLDIHAHACMDARTHVCARTHHLTHKCKQRAFTLAATPWCRGTQLRQNICLFPAPSEPLRHRQVATVRPQVRP